MIITSAVPKGQSWKPYWMVRPWPLRLVDAGRHAFVGDEEIMQAAGPGQTDLIGGIEHGGRVAQQLAGMVDGEGLEEGLGAQARPSG